MGKKRIKTEFENALEQDGINLVASELLFVPYPKKMRVRENYYHTYYKHRGVLILPERAHEWLGLWSYYLSKITAFRVLTALMVIVFASMVVKDYFVLKAASKYIPPLVNALADLLLLWGALILGFLLGKEIMRRKISCSWSRTNSGLSSKANIIGDYLCWRPLLGSGPYAVVYHLVDVGEISFDEAEKVYKKFKFVIQNKMDLSEWSKIDLN